MRVFALVLLYASRVLAVFAMLAGIAAGGLIATLLMAFTCFDSCPSPDDYFFHFALDAERLLIPCVAFEALALIAFVAYCAMTGQTLRAIQQTALVLVGALIGAAALTAEFQMCQATLPITQYYIVSEAPAVMWMQWWGFSIMIVAGGWSWILALLQWPRGGRQRPAGLQQA